MKDQINSELLKLLQSANKASEGSIAFLQERLPILYKQVVAWEIGFHTLFVVVFCILTVLSAWGVKKRLPMLVESWNEDGPDLIWVISACSFITSLCFCVGNLVEIIRALAAPDMVVLEYFRM